ncbi:aminotransferase, Class III pyridoxal-phosphate dependent [hydrothermal vent metagenome]|uniref:Aminotransferase, Class III pyridoxal-phosphate dependent n=1 Tax=hydrothermal vent metagenome TaxID=652676 RepID=A0A3B0WHC5_9ZZZZ
MQEKAEKFIPGMTQLLSKRPDQFSLGVWPGYFSKAKGVEVWDLDGNKYIDMSIGGIGANILGYADPDVDKSIHEAIDKGVSSSLNCPEEVELAELLCQMHPWAEKVRYARTGGESMAMAVRIARCYTGRDKVAFCGYHGWHDWYLSANLNQEDALEGHLLPGLNPSGVPKVLKETAFPFRYNHIEELREIVLKHKNELAAIIMEPIRSEQPKDNFLEEVQIVAKEINAVLIIDEISAGFRLNSGGAHLTFNLKPDIAVFAKALGNGYPMAAVIGISSVMEAVQETFISSTNWTERTGPVAALAMIKKHQRLNVAQHLNEIGRKVQEGWKSLSKKHGLNINVSGIYPLSHFTFEYEEALVMKAYFIQEMLNKGFLVSNLFYAMFAHQSIHVEQYLQAVDEVFGKMMSFYHKGNLEEQLKGKPAVSGFKRLA